MKLPATFALALALGAGTLAAQAQTKLPPRRPAQPRPKPTAPVGITMKDGFQMKEGKVMVTRDAHTEELTSETALVNGTKIKADVTVTMADGTTATLKEGDYVSLTGRLTTRAMKAEQDSLAQLARDGGKGKMKNKKRGR